VTQMRGGQLAPPLSGLGADGTDHEQWLQTRELARTRARAAREHRAVRMWQLTLLVLFLVSWTLGSGRIIDSLFVSDPWSVAQAFWRILVDGTLWFHLRFTLVEMVLGYALGASAALVLAVLVSLIPNAEPITRPFTLAAYAIPKIALAPLIIIWFGIGILPKVILAATLVFFFVYFNTLAGLASVSPGLISTVRVMNASTLSVFTKVSIPNATPLIITALRIGLPAALIGAIIGEFISSNRGIGYMISAASSRYNTDEVFAGILSLLIFVLLINTVLTAFERHLLRWRPAPRRTHR
jgi:NitT/TauT family transport system permease protein